MNTQPLSLSELLSPRGFEEFLNERGVSVDADHCARVVLGEMGFEERESGRVMLAEFFRALSVATPAEKAQLAQAYPAHLLAICMSLICYMETEADQAEAYRIMAGDFPELFEVLNEQLATHFSGWVEMGRKYGATNVPTVH